MAHTSGSTQALIDLYAAHPLREETILSRILRTRGTLEGITELDLAHDSLTGLTDQNHVGGVPAVVQLAAAAGVSESSRVLDLGCGLGGPARLMASCFGCRVHGIELSPRRCEDANRLTGRVGLTALVSVECGDMLAVDLPRRAFDVVYGQGAWIHVADLAALFRRIAAALAPGGRVAFEEGCLLRSAKDAAEASALGELEVLWGGRFATREAWRAAMEAASFGTPAVVDLTGVFVRELERLDEIARAQGAGHYPAHETRAVALAIALARAGVIGYARAAAGVLPA